MFPFSHRTSGREGQGAEGERKEEVGGRMREKGKKKDWVRLGR